MKERIGNLLKAINRGLYEKETETALSLLAAIAGESIILLGAPGVAKSMVARRLKLAFKNASAFEYLMSRFSTPDEIFGPVSISRLKTNDEYVRSTKGYLPTADVVFLDEIWKAGPAIQNTLLTAINEKLFRNGAKETHIPMKLLIAASNELPAQGDGLEALWDRFIIRLECRGIKKEANFDMMLLDDSCDCPEMPSEELQISDEEYSLWQADINKVAVSKTILECIHSIRHSIRAVHVEGSDERRDIYISDRRWKKIIRLIRTSAYLQDRHMVELADVIPAYHCLWQEPEERDGVRSIVINAAFSPLASRLTEFKKSLKDDIRRHRANNASQRLADGSGMPSLAAGMESRDYQTEIEEIADSILNMEHSIKDSLFVSEEDKMALRSLLEPLKKEIAFTRQDIIKLYD